MAADPFSVGRLRWKVTIAQRNQTPATTGGITEIWQTLATVWADIQPIGSLTFWAGMQTETPVTHRVIVRWVNYLDNTFAILRPTNGPNKVIRNEIFRVRRVADMDGRKRFTVLDVELEALL